MPGEPLPMPSQPAGIPPIVPTAPAAPREMSLSAEVLSQLTQDARVQLTQEWPELAALAPESTDLSPTAASLLSPTTFETGTSALPVGLITSTSTAIVPAATGGYIPAAPAAKKQRVAGPDGKMVAADWGRISCKKQMVPSQNSMGFYLDIIWTPQLEVEQKEHWQRECSMCHALFRAVENLGIPQGVPLSQIGGDFKVAQLKKEPQFRNAKLIDLLRRFEDVFEFVIDPAGGGGGWLVKLQPGAQAALPGIEDILENELQEQMSLPDRIEDPRSTREKMQALRIDLIHAMKRRGQNVGVQELGQEPRIQQRKQGLAQAKKLIDFIKLFPTNFTITVNEHSIPHVDLVSCDVDDQSMIDNSIIRNQQAYNNHMASKGKGKGHDRGRDYHGSLGSSSLGSPSVSSSSRGFSDPYAGYAAAHAAHYAAYYAAQATGQPPPPQGFSPAPPAAGHPPPGYGYGALPPHSQDPALGSLQSLYAAVPNYGAGPAAGYPPPGYAMGPPRI